MRLIDADEYKEKLYAMMPKFDEENDKTCIEGQTIFFCIATLDDMPTITPPPNDLLTLDELREMVGEPVYITPLDENADWNPKWAIIHEDYMIVNSVSSESRVYILQNEDYGKTWFAYRRKPEEGMT